MASGGQVACGVAHDRDSTGQRSAGVQGQVAGTALTEGKPEAQEPPPVV